MGGIVAACGRGEHGVHRYRSSSSSVRFGGGAGGGWRVFPFLCALLVLCWMPAVVVRAAEVPVAVDAETQLTIASIEPDAGSRTVKSVSPAHPLQGAATIQSLPVGESAGQSSYDDDGVLTLHGKFRYGERHIISLPDNLQVEERLRQDVNEFHAGLARRDPVRRWQNRDRTRQPADASCPPAKRRERPVSRPPCAAAAAAHRRGRHG
jgi:hypothetical protein